MKNLRDVCTGVQHIGLPSNDFNKTVQWYEGLGFTVKWQKPAPEPVAFLELGNCVIEVYSPGYCAKKAGAWDHVALNTTDIDAVFEWAKQNGYQCADQQVNFIPFFEKGVKYFTIIGTCGENVEFNQYL